MGLFRGSNSLSRRNRGVDCPWGKFCLIAGLIAAALIAGQYALLYPCISPWVCGCLSGAMGLGLLLYLALLHIDAADENCKQHQQVAAEHLRWCPYCYCYVTNSTRTKHCWSCRKCVHGFDHHCEYLQSCVGTKNYPIFFGLVCCLEVWSAALFCADLILLTTDTECCRRWHTEGMVMVAMHAALALLVLCFSSALLALHAYLVISNQTTYELIVKRRNKPRRSLLLRLSMAVVQMLSAGAAGVSSFSSSVYSQGHRLTRVVRMRSKAGSARAKHCVVSEPSPPVADPSIKSNDLSIEQGYGPTEVSRHKTVSGATPSGTAETQHKGTTSSRTQWQRTVPGPMDNLAERCMESSDSGNNGIRGGRSSIGSGSRGGGLKYLTDGDNGTSNEGVEVVVQPGCKAIVDAGMKIKATAKATNGDGEAYDGEGSGDKAESLPESLST